MLELERSFDNLKCSVGTMGPNHGDASRTYFELKRCESNAFDIEVLKNSVRVSVSGRSSFENLTLALLWAQHKLSTLWNTMAEEKEISSN